MLCQVAFGKNISDEKMSYVSLLHFFTFMYWNTVHMCILLQCYLGQRCLKFKLYVPCFDLMAGHAGAFV